MTSKIIKRYLKEINDIQNIDHTTASIDEQEGLAEQEFILKEDLVNTLLARLRRIIELEEQVEWLQEAQEEFEDEKLRDNLWDAEFEVRSDIARREWELYGDKILYDTLDNVKDWDKNEIIELEELTKGGKRE